MLYNVYMNASMIKIKECINMSKFDLDAKVLKNDVPAKEPYIKSKSLCTPGCNPTATLCTSCIFACA